MTQHPDDLGDNTVVYLPSLYRRDFTAAVQSAPIRPTEDRALVWPLVVMVLAFAAVALMAWHLGMAAHASAVAQGALMMEGGL